MHDMVVDAVRRDDHVADVLGVERHLQSQRVFNRPHRDDGVHGGADAADALGENPGVARVAVLEDDLDAAPHLPRRPGIGNLAVVHLAVDAQVAFDAGDGIDGDSGHDGLP